jgi:hypothetical protein
MAFTNQSTVSLVDFITKLDSFLTTNGWTQDEFTVGDGTWAVSNVGTGREVRIVAQWDTSSPNFLALYHYIGGAYDSMNDPWGQINDSGNGTNAGTLDTQIDDSRSVQITNTPVQFWAFEDDYYVHVVVEISTGAYRHFGFGMLDKFNDWDGGAYCYGQWPGAGPNYNTGVSENVLAPFDGFSSGSLVQRYTTTLHVENVGTMLAAQKWAIHGSDGMTITDQDRQASPQDRERLVWGARNGPVAIPFAPQAGTDLAGNAPLTPIVVALADTTGQIPLGQIQDVRQVSMRNYVGGNTIVVGSDTWYLFPAMEKKTSLFAATGNIGLAYKQVS